MQRHILAPDYKYVMYAAAASRVCVVHTGVVSVLCICSYIYVFVCIYIYSFCEFVRELRRGGRRLSLSSGSLYPWKIIDRDDCVFGIGITVKAKCCVAIHKVITCKFNFAI